MDPDFRRVASPKSVPVAPPSPTETPIKKAFRTPEQVAAEDSVHMAELSESSDQNANISKVPSGDSLAARLKRLLTAHEKSWLASLVIVLICGSLAGIILIKATKKPIAQAKPIRHVVVAPKPTTVPSTLTGLPVTPDINQRPVTAVMIENSLQARPQSGLSQAGVVFEAIAEGGVTRFMALYQDTAPGNIGPVRSARPYYLQWEMGFDAAYAHVGGSPDALSDITAWGVRDLNEFYNAGAYHRISSRAAPHNMYTSIGNLNQLEAAKGYTTSTYTGFIRKNEAPAKTPTARSINLVLSGPYYNAHYDYVAATNSYNRSEGGAPHIDANTNTQISPKVVVALVVPYSLGALDSTGAYYSDYAAIGSGQLYVFQDGTVTTGTWQKADNKSQLVFTGADGKPLRLNAGQTWITAVATSSKVTYTP